MVISKGHCVTIMNLANFLKNEENRKNIKNMVKPVVDMLYNELCIYIWFFIVYVAFLLLLGLANLILLINLVRTMSKITLFGTKNQNTD